MLLAVDSLVYEDCVKLDRRVYRRVPMTNLPLTLGDAEDLNEWKSGVCGSTSWSIRELENLVVNEAIKVVVEKQTPLPSQLARSLAGKCINKEALSMQMSEGTEPSVPTFIGEETIEDFAQFSDSEQPTLM